MKITSHNKTFEWRLRLVEWRYAQAALLGTALISLRHSEFCFMFINVVTVIVALMVSTVILFARQAFYLRIKSI